MAKITSKKALEIALSKLKGFEKAKVSSEQYITPSSIAAEVLWKAYYNGHIDGKTVIDLGSGTGILGIGCLLLGAKKVFLVDKDEDSLKICKENIKKVTKQNKLGEWEIVLSDIADFDRKADSVIMNPPFGTKKRHIDRIFLEKALSLANVTHSFHKTTTSDYILQYASKNGFNVKERFDFDFLLKNTMKHHTKQKEYIKVSCFLFEKQQ